MRSLTKSPVAFVKAALATGRRAFKDYSHRQSPKKYTSPQLFAILALKEFLQQDYRGIVALLSEWSDLREALELKSVPHYTTLQKASARLLKKTPAVTCLMEQLLSPVSASSSESAASLPPLTPPAMKPAIAALISDGAPARESVAFPS